MFVPTTSTRDVYRIVSPKHRYSSDTLRSRGHHKQRDLGVLLHHPVMNPERQGSHLETLDIKYQWFRFLDKVDKTKQFGVFLLNLHNVFFQVHKIGCLL